jgi:hypothetical protein
MDLRVDVEDLVWHLWEADLASELLAMVSL